MACVILLPTIYNCYSKYYQSKFYVTVGSFVIYTMNICLENLIVIKLHYVSINSTQIATKGIVCIYLWFNCHWPYLVTPTSNGH